MTRRHRIHEDCGAAGVVLAIVQQLLYEKGILVSLTGSLITDATALVGIQTWTIILGLLIGLLVAGLKR